MEHIQTTLSDLTEFVSLEMLEEIVDEYLSIQDLLQNLELENIFSREEDHGCAMITINAGAGGMESQYWVSKMYGAYLRYTESKGWTYDIVDTHHTDTGFKNVTFIVYGDKAYGFLKTETGVHRFCRVSPYDSSGKKHTSFISVDVIPFHNKETRKIEEVPASEIEISNYRASGPGGQHVNKTSSAVRIKHIPTGITVQCQSERSFLRNKSQALNMLSSKLYQIQKDREKEDVMRKYLNKSDNSFGHQIRTYEMVQEQYIKDHRTGYCHHQLKDALEGDLDPLIRQALFNL